MHVELDGDEVGSSPAHLPSASAGSERQPAAGPSCAVRAVGATHESDVAGGTAAMVRGAEPLEAVERWGLEPANSEADAEAELATLKARSAEIAHELAEWTLSPQNPQARTHRTRSEMRAHARQAVASERAAELRVHSCAPPGPRSARGACEGAG